MNKDKAQEILKNIVNEFGEEIFINKNRAQGLIADYFAGEIKTKKMLANAIRESLPKRLLDTKGLSDIEKETNIAKIKYFYKEDNGLDENTANFIVECFIYALKVESHKQTLTYQSEQTIRNDQTIQVNDLPTKVFTSDDARKYKKDNVVVIPYGFTKIDDSAFNSSSLEIVKIPDSVREIGYHAFSECRRLGSIKIPYGVTSIGSYVFDDCICLESIAISNSVTSIGDYAFNYCHNLKEITIPDSVTSIGRNLFGESCWMDSIKTKIKCTKGSYAEKYLLENSLGNLIENIDNNKFMKTNKTIKKELPQKIFTSDDIKKYENDNSVEIPYGYTKVDSIAFYGCRNLVSITIPENVTDIGEGAFYNCQNLNSITIPSSVTRIESYTFDYCVKLSSIMIPEGVTKIDCCAFEGCMSLSSVIIPHSVVSIGGSAFAYCESLVEITIPDSVTSIGWSLFYGCDKLKVVKCKRGSYAEKYMKENSLGNLIVYL